MPCSGSLSPECIETLLMSLCTSNQELIEVPREHIAKPTLPRYAHKSSYRYMARFAETLVTEFVIPSRKGTTPHMQGITSYFA